MTRLIDTRTAAAALGVTPRTIRRWIADGTLTNRGTGRRIRVAVADLHTAKTRRAIRLAAYRI